MSEVLVIGPRLRELESIIERGMQAFVEVGNALLAIRSEGRQAERGYAKGHAGFDAYCRDHLGFERRRANQLIAAAQTAAEIEAENPGTTVPQTERQARELARAEVPSEVWAEVVEQHAPAEITAAVIREHVEARKMADPKMVTAVDESGLYLGDVLVDVYPLCEAITSAVRAAHRGGASTQEMYAAYQAGFH